MKSFKEWQSNGSERPVVLWYLTDDHEAVETALLAIEEGQTVQLDARYSARYDIAKQPNQKNHTHVMLKGNDVCIVNDDGTSSHGSPAFATLPAKIQTAIKNRGYVDISAAISENASSQPNVLSRALIVSFWLRLLLPLSER